MSFYSNSLPASSYSQSQLHALRTLIQSRLPYFASLREFEKTNFNWSTGLSTVDSIRHLCNKFDLPRKEAEEISMQWMVNASTIERLLDGIIDSDPASYVEEEEEGGRNTVTRYTRAGKKGKEIRCPHCEKAIVVPHFKWSSLTCGGCESEVKKYSWLV